ncbi:substrate-binding domain-containing protein [Streptomyces sp. NPDC004237]|uniref:substrate-binding domain-containing protein n=1 Tax=Streptomyces sp. NPDC004237 TaxID=3154455 RepID=UPI0033AD3C7A
MRRPRPAGAAAGTRSRDQPRRLALTRLGARHLLSLDGGDGEDRFRERAIDAAQARHLFDRSHRRLDYALPEAISPRRPVAQQRLTGAIGEATARRAPATAPAHLPLDRHAIALQLRQWRADGISAVDAPDDLVVLGILAALHDLGLSVPGDLAVIGADNHAQSRLALPTLTTAWVPDADRGDRTRSGLTPVGRTWRRSSDSLPPRRHPGITSSRPQGSHISVETWLAAMTAA